MGEQLNLDNCCYCATQKKETQKLGTFIWFVSHLVHLMSVNIGACGSVPLFLGWLTGMLTISSSCGSSGGCHGTHVITAALESRDHPCLAI